MSEHCAHIKLAAALMLTTVAMFLGFTGSVFGQTSDNKPKQVAAAEPKPTNPDNKISPADSRSDSRPKDLQSEVESLKAENAAVREQKTFGVFSL